MTIQQMHDRVDQWLDTVHTARFPVDQKDRALNTAISQVVNDRYYPLNPKDRENAFESNQRIRDELYPLIVNAPAISANTDFISISTLTNYRFLLSLNVIIDGKTYSSIPSDYNEWTFALSKDPYAAPRIEEPYNVYHLEEATGLRVKWGSVGILQWGMISYLRNPIVVSLTGGINCDLPINLHEEICQIAGQILKSQVQNLKRQGGEDS